MFRDQLTLLFISFFFSSNSLLAQNSGSTFLIKSEKLSYAWEEKVIIRYEGLPVREAYKAIFDDIIIVPAGTPEGDLTNAQRVYVSNSNGETAFIIPKSGLYEARLYLYEKPGVIAARSESFKIASVEEGPLETKSNEHLLQIAMRNRNSNKMLMCGAINEYFKRKPSTGEKNYSSMKALQSICPKDKTGYAVTVKAPDNPLVARYQCYRILMSGNEVAEDIHILAGNQYKTMNRTGKFTYNPETKILTFTTGPLANVQKWIGVYTSKGEPTPSGGITQAAMIEIRRQADVKAGNKKVLQQCSCVQ